MWSLLSVCWAQSAPSADRSDVPPADEGEDGDAYLSDAPPLALPAVEVPLPSAPSPALLETLSFVSTADADRDVVVLIARDGARSLAGQDVQDVTAWLAARVAEAPETRIVLQPEPGAPYDAVFGALRDARSLTDHVALAEVQVWKPSAGLFDGSVQPEMLADALTRRDRRRLRPKRYKFPQDPYQNTNPYTAYTLEWGESEIGLTSVTTGVLPRVQIGTAPLLDVVGALNVQAKVGLTREGPLDVAISGQYYNVPVASVLSNVGAGSLLEGAGGLTETASASYLGLGAGASLQVAKPWSVHGQVYWARPSAKGEIAFDDLPELLLPGLSLGGSAAVGLGVSGDLVILNAATDLRFNRRDSLFLWARWPCYGRVRGMTNGSIGGFEQLAAADFMVAYGGTIPMATSLSIAGGYQASFEHVEARVGLGWSAVPYTWLMQAFELSYKFGGPTRREHREIRQGFRRSPDEQGTADAAQPSEGG